MPRDRGRSPLDLIKRHHVAIGSTQTSGVRSAPQSYLVIAAMRPTEQGRLKVAQNGSPAGKRRHQSIFIGTSLDEIEAAKNEVLETAEDREQMVCRHDRHRYQRPDTSDRHRVHCAGSCSCALGSDHHLGAELKPGADMAAGRDEAGSCAYRALRWPELGVLKARLLRAAKSDSPSAFGVVKPRPNPQYGRRRMAISIPRHQDASTVQMTTGRSEYPAVAGQAVRSPVWPVAPVPGCIHRPATVHVQRAGFTGLESTRRHRPPRTERLRHRACHFRSWEGVAGAGPPFASPGCRQTSSLPCPQTLPCLWRAFQDIIQTVRRQTGRRIIWPVGHFINSSSSSLNTRGSPVRNSTLAGDTSSTEIFPSVTGTIEHRRQRQGPPPARKRTLPIFVCIHHHWLMR